MTGVVRTFLSHLIWSVTVTFYTLFFSFWSTFITLFGTHTFMLLPRMYFYHEDMKCKCNMMNSTVWVTLPHLNSFIYFCHCPVPCWLAWERWLRVLTEQQQQHKSVCWPSQTWQLLVPHKQQLHTTEYIFSAFKKNNLPSDLHVMQWEVIFFLSVILRDLSCHGNPKKKRLTGVKYCW